jgi:hypothetical protein
VDEAEVEALDDEQPRTPQISAVRLIVGFLVALTAVTGHLPPRPVLVFVAFVVTGALFWKAPPFDVGPRVGLVNGFVPATLHRIATAVREVGGWTLGFGVWGLVSGGLLALMRTNQSVVGHCVAGAIWGMLGGALVGSIVWAGQQAARDVEILRAAEED